MIDRSWFLRSSFFLWLVLFNLFIFYPEKVQAKKKINKIVVGSVLPAPVYPTIVIDPGHGGADRGTRSKTPFCEEKRICLQTARLVKKYLDQLGYHVVMTRTNDAFITLQRRVEIAKQAGSSIFVSIHFNSAQNPSAQGVEIFFHDNKEDKSKTISSKRLAEAILPGILRRTSAQSRGVKKGNYFVLRESSMPAIIVEGGFISNPEECKLLKTLNYQDNIARAIADGIDRYFKLNSDS